jgi:DNA mismatch endonuclease (patch repair protein)
VVQLEDPDVEQKRRSRMMSRIRGKNTKPALAVRKAAHGLGFRYRIHARELPGCPDLLFSRRKIAMFVHGCFWHRHENCRYSYAPKSNIEFWEKKFQNNVARDARVRGELEGMGWKVAVVWECETADSIFLADKVKGLLSQ